MSGSLNLGLWGAGAWARICVRSILKIPAIRIHSVFDADAGAGRELAASVGALAPATEAQFLEDPGLDAVCVMTPNHRHKAHVLMALQHGLHVFVEKPLTNQRCEALEIQAELANSSRILFVGHNTRREARFRAIRKFVDEGQLGQPVIASCAFTSEAGLGKQLGQWRYDRVACPSVALSQIGIHAIDLLSYLLGPIVEVQSWVKNVGLEADVDDVCLARFMHDGGVCSMFLNSYSTPRERSVNIYGTKAVIRSYCEDRVEVQQVGNAVPFSIPVEPNDTILEQYREFVDCCLTGKPPETGFKAGFDAVSIFEAVLESSANGGRIEKIQT